MFFIILFFLPEIQKANFQVLGLSPAALHGIFRLGVRELYSMFYNTTK